MRRPKTARAKQIVYLIGAGATQAEVDYLGAARVNLLMQSSEQLGLGVSASALGRAGRQALPFAGEYGLDIEKLISLLSTCGVTRLSLLAESMRRHYFEEIHQRLIEARIMDRPGLATALFEMHRDDLFQTTVESLSGVITTNHDGLLQIAAQDVYGSLNLGIPFSSTDFVMGAPTDAPMILQIHGSFTWRFAVPTSVRRLTPRSTYSRDTVWIPPSILKETKNYPFNKLAALAYELLARHCDVLRIIGASLTQNDWNILTLIFNAQRHRELTHGAAFRIELIMPQEAGERIQRECAYLKNTAPIAFLTDGDFSRYKDSREISSDPELMNPFAYWLSQKLTLHNRRAEIAAPTEKMLRLVGAST